MASVAPESFGIRLQEWSQFAEPWDSRGPSEIQLLLFASFAYFDPSHIKTLGWSHFGFDSPPNFMFISAGRYQAYSLSVGNDLILGFRGTELPALQPRVIDLLGLAQFARDWFTNFDFAHQDTPHGAVHKGFHNALHALWPQISPIIRKFSAQSPIGRIYVTGHSQGGAIATIATYNIMLLQLPNSLLLCTFAPPMVGNQTFVEWMDKTAQQRHNIKLIRYTNDHDPIPLLPPSSELTPYYPGPGIHVHLRSDPHLPFSQGTPRVVFWDGGMDPFYTSHLPRFAPGHLIDLMSFVVTLVPHLLSHYPAGPEIDPNHPPDTRPGYLPFLLPYPPPNMSAHQ